MIICKLALKIYNRNGARPCFNRIHSVLFFYITNNGNTPYNTTLQCHITQCYMFQLTRTIIRHFLLQRFINIIIGCTALGGPWTPQANFASDLYPGHPPASFYHPVSLRLPLPRQSILISVGHVLTTIYKRPKFRDISLKEQLHAKMYIF